MLRSRRKKMISWRKETVMTNDMTKGSPVRLILSFMIPTYLGNIFQQFYNLVDSIVAGRYIGVNALAAIGSTASLIFLVIGWLNGITSGFAIMVAQSFGAKDYRKMRHYIAMSILLCFGFVVVMTGGLLVLNVPILRLINTPADIIGDTAAYMRIIYAGLFVTGAYNAFAAVLRALGDSRSPLYFLIVGCMTNIVLDVVLVLFFHMGVAGAAWATILSQLAAAVLVIATLLKTDDMYRLNWREVRIHPDMLLRIIQIGLPAGLQSVMYSASNIIIQSSVNALGTNVVAAWTAYGKIDVIYWTIINAFGISITTFVGQNFGAGKLDRVYKGIRVCLGISAGATIFLSLLLYQFGQYIYLLFTTDAEVIAKGVEILHFLVPTLITYVCIEILSGALRGIGDCWIPMIMTALGVCLLRVVWIVVAVPLYPDIKTICFSYPLTWTVTSILFLVYFKWFSKIRKMKGIS